MESAGSSLAKDKDGFEYWNELCRKVDAPQEWKTTRPLPTPPSDELSTELKELNATLERRRQQRQQERLERRQMERETQRLHRLPGTSKSAEAGPKRSRKKRRSRRHSRRRPAGEAMSWGPGFSCGGETSENAADAAVAAAADAADALVSRRKWISEKIADLEKRVDGIGEFNRNESRKIRWNEVRRNLSELISLVGKSSGDAHGANRNDEAVTFENIEDEDAIDKAIKLLHEQNQALEDAAAKMPPRGQLRRMAVGRRNLDRSSFLESQSTHRRSSAGSFGEGLPGTEFLVFDEDVVTNTKIKALDAGQIGPLVPNLLYKYQLKPEAYKEFNGIVVFCDISGFTALSQTLSGKVDPKVAAETLHKDIGSYLTVICQTIMALSGDILNFAGDAVLAVWEFPDTSDMAINKENLDPVIIAILNLQMVHGNHETSVRTMLRFKTGIAWGQYYIGYLGNSRCKYFCCFGQAIEEANSAEALCSQSWTVLTPATWSNVSQNFYLCDYLDGGYVRIKGLTEEGRAYGRKIVYSLNHPMTMKVRNFQDESQDSRLLRSFRAFVPPPVLKKLDNNQSLDFLSEMRVISAAFVHVESSFAAESPENLLHILQLTFVILFNAFDSFKANIHKIITFDKGLEFLIILGFPGMKQEHEARNILTCSYEAIMDIRDEPLIEDSAIGVASGQAFCGVIGHQERHEYSVLGRCVNMACRFMQNYPGEVTCDTDIYRNSQLPVGDFKLAEKKVLKGLDNVGAVYHYRGARNPFADMEVEEVETESLKLYARDDILLTFDFVIEQLIMSLEDEKKHRVAREARMRHRVYWEQNRLYRETPHAILIEGEGGMGKTALCDALKIKASNNLIGRTMVQCKVSHVETAFAGIRLVLRMALRINDRELPKVIHGKLTAFAKHSAPLVKHMPLVCVIFGLEISEEELGPYFKPTHHQESDTEILKKINPRYVEACLQCIGSRIGRDRPHIFIIDDAQYLDSASWRCVVALGRGPTTFCVLAFRTLRKDMASFGGCLSLQQDPWVSRYVLNKLSRNDVVFLANQILCTMTIPIALTRVIRSVTDGNPLLLHMLIEEMRSSMKIKVVEIPLNPSEVEKAKKMMESFPGISTERCIGILMQQFPSLKKLRDDEFDLHKRKRSLIRLYPTGGQHEEQRIMREMRRKLLEVSLGMISTDVQSLEIENYNEEDVSFLQRRPDDHSMDPTKLYMCIVEKEVDLVHFVVPTAIREMAVSILDNIDETEQLIIKSAAVLGVAAFQKPLLQEVFPNKDKEAYKQCIRKLFELRLFSCARATVEGYKCPNPVCRCNRNGYFDTSACEYLFFCHPILAEEAYKVLTTTVATKRHREAADFIENTKLTLRCSIRNREPFFQFHPEFGYCGPLIHPLVYVKGFQCMPYNSVRTTALLVTGTLLVIPESTLRSLSRVNFQYVPKKKINSSDESIADILEQFEPNVDEVESWIEMNRNICYCDEALYNLPQVIFHRRVAKDYRLCLTAMLHCACANFEMGRYLVAEQFILEAKSLQDQEELETISVMENHSIDEMLGHCQVSAGKPDVALDVLLRVGSRWKLPLDGEYYEMRKKIKQRRQVEEKNTDKFFGMATKDQKEFDLLDKQFQWLWLQRISLHAVDRNLDAVWASQLMLSNTFRMGVLYKVALSYLMVVESCRAVSTDKKRNKTLELYEHRALILITDYIMVNPKITKLSADPINHRIIIARIATIAFDFHLSANRCDRAFKVAIQMSGILRSCHVMTGDLVLFMGRVCYYALEAGDADQLDDLMGKLYMCYIARKDVLLLCVYCIMALLSRLTLGLPIGNMDLITLAETVNGLGMKRSTESIVAFLQFSALCLYKIRLGDRSAATLYAYIAVATAPKTLHTITTLLGLLLFFEYKLIDHCYLLVEKDQEKIASSKADLTSYLKYIQVLAAKNPFMKPRAEVLYAYWDMLQGKRDRPSRTLRKHRACCERAHRSSYSHWCKLLLKLWFPGLMTTKEESSLRRMTMTMTPDPSGARSTVTVKSSLVRDSQAGGRLSEAIAKRKKDKERNKLIANKSSHFSEDPRIKALQEWTDKVSGAYRKSEASSSSSSSFDNLENSDEEFKDFEQTLHAEVELPAKKPRDLRIARGRPAKGGPSQLSVKSIKSSMGDLTAQTGATKGVELKVDHIPHPIFRQQQKEHHHIHRWTRGTWAEIVQSKENWKNFQSLDQSWRQYPLPLPENIKIENTLPSKKKSYTPPNVIGQSMTTLLKSKSRVTSRKSIN